MDTINFIKGRFTPSEAQEILLDAITKKINFYNLKNFSSQVRYEVPDAEAEARMEELKEARTQLLAKFQIARESNCEIVIESTIHVSLVVKEQPVALCSEAEAC